MTFYCSGGWICRGLKSLHIFFLSFHGRQTTTSAAGTQSCSKSSQCMWKDFHSFSHSTQKQLPKLQHALHLTLTYIQMIHFLKRKTFNPYFGDEDWRNQWGLHNISSLKKKIPSVYWLKIFCPHNCIFTMLYRSVINIFCIKFSLTLDIASPKKCKGKVSVLEQPNIQSMAVLCPHNEGNASWG